MVEYLKINEKEYPVRIGYYVMKKVQEKTGKTLGEAMQEAEKDPSLHETILYSALQMGAFAEHQELDLKEDDMAMILDLVFQDYLKLFTSEKFFPKELAEKVEKRLGEVEKEPEKNGISRTKKTKVTT